MRDGFRYDLSFSELARAANMDKRQIQHLSDAKLLPEPDGVRRLKRVALVGALVGAGLGLFPAGRLAAAIVSEAANEYDGEAPDGSKAIGRALVAERPQVRDRADDPLFVYFAARTMSSILIAGAARADDVIIEIVDGRQVYLDYSATGLNVLGAVDGRSFLGEMRPLARAHDVDFMAAGELAPVSADVMRARLAGAVTRLNVNCSLAIRNAYERLLDHDPRIIRRVERPA